jgi:hypothetical protein
MLNQQKVTALKLAIQQMVARIVASSGMQEEEVIQLITGKIASDAVASAGTATDQLASVKGAYLASQKAIADGFTGAGGEYDSLLKLATKLAASDSKVATLEEYVNSLDNVFEYVGELAGGVDAAAAFDLGTLAADKRQPGNYYKVSTKGFFKLAGSTFFANAKDGLVFNAAGGVDLMDNSNSAVAGTTDQIEVTGTEDDGFKVKLAQAVIDQLISLETLITQLGIRGVLEPIPYSVLLGGETPSEYTALDTGVTTLVFDAASVTVPANFVGKVGTVAVSAENDSCQFSVVVDGVTYTRSVNPAVLVDGKVTDSGWLSSAGDADSLIDTLIAEFNAAAQPVQG